MAGKVDDLFQSDGTSPRPRSGAVRALVILGTILAIVGLPCSSVPGGLMVLGGWFLVDQDKSHLASGYLSAEHSAEVDRLYRLTMFGVTVTLITFFLQAWLFCSGFYTEFWSGILKGASTFLRR